MTTHTELSLNARKAMEIIQNAQAKGWMSEEEHQRTQAQLRALGINVVMEVTESDEDEDGDELPATDEDGRTFFEVSIHPFVKQIADENGDPVEGNWFNPCSDDLDGYPDAMFQKGWSVSSWVREGDEDEDGEIDAVDDEEFPDYESASARAEELAAKYRVEIDCRY